jgi:phosphoribosyl-AMP cyclohydrolase / phosphoribosyl-ATP pyrophosphohydrolase
VSSIAAQVAWDERGLAPAVVTDQVSGAVLMLGWMNAEALEATLATGQVTFFSRSRQALWRKGETSGNTLAVRSIRLDCDADALLIEAIPAGPTCHTGATSCFYRRAEDGAWREDAGPRGAGAAVVDRVYAVLESRAQAPPEKSYTASLLAGGMPKIAGKVEEEAGELLAELRADGPREKVVHEAADLLFHVLAALLARAVSTQEIWAELERRFGTSGHAEKAARR